MLFDRHSHKAMIALPGPFHFNLATPFLQRITRSARHIARRSGFLMGIASLTGVAMSASGEFDVSFGNGGLARLDIVPNATPGIGNDTANAMAVQPDDKIVAVNGHKGVFALIRHTRDGPLDPSFGGDGKVTTGFGTLSASANAVVLQPDGRIVAAGVCGADFAVARYLANGELDSTFSDDGRTITSISSGTDIARRLPCSQMEKS